ncbi:HemK methyltransferase family member 2 [Holothuria leucospilota]|uniref:Methyltransferase HEMK2 n=1 Tax=Holothuria leucospilota TaxID=206669 RepID=A0A9Q0YIQ1_HOLLE|nr:HemK methyltransferase family member 2 [Holothuria leucospilota]
MNQTSRSSTFPTPDYSHLSVTDFDDIYEPAEDSFLLLDALEKDVDFLNSLSPLICLEVGCGSGIVITFLRQILVAPCLCLAVDRNPKAAQCTMRTGEQNHVQVEVVTSDLLNSFQPKLDGKVDVLVFNPPYVVTPPEEVEVDGLARSWAGGINGRQVLDRLLPDVHKLLSPKAVFYLVTTEENRPDEIKQLLQQDGFHSTTVLQRKSGPERLSVIKFERRLTAVT